MIFITRTSMNGSDYSYGIRHKKCCTEKGKRKAFKDILHELHQMNPNCKYYEVDLFDNIHNPYILEELKNYPEILSQLKSPKGF